MVEVVNTEHDRLVRALEALVLEMRKGRVLREKELDLQVIEADGRLYVQGRSAPPAPPKKDAHRR